LPDPKSDGITLAKVSLAEAAIDKRSLERAKLGGSEAAVVLGKLPAFQLEVRMLFAPAASYSRVEADLPGLVV
jgi:hypothetical protein